MYSSNPALYRENVPRHMPPNPNGICLRTKRILSLLTHLLVRVQHIFQTRRRFRITGPLFVYYKPERKLIICRHICRPTPQSRKPSPAPPPPTRTPSPLPPLATAKPRKASRPTPPQQQISPRPPLICLYNPTDQQSIRYVSQSRPPPGYVRMETSAPVYPPIYILEPEPEEPPPFVWNSTSGRRVMVQSGVYTPLMRRSASLPPRDRRRSTISLPSSQTRYGWWLLYGRDLSE